MSSKLKINKLDHIRRVDETITIDEPLGSAPRVLHKETDLLPSSVNYIDNRYISPIDHKVVKRHMAVVTRPPPTHNFIDREFSAELAAMSYDRPIASSSILYLNRKVARPNGN
jgi:hypothetical protein